MLRINYFWRNSRDLGQDARNMRGRPPMKYIRPLLSLSLLAIAIVGSGCNQTSSTKYDGGFDEATITISPTAYSFPNTALGETSPAGKFTLTNIGLEPTGPVAHVIE